MKQIAALFLIGSLLLACASNPCDSDDALTKFAQENALKYFPVPASVNFTMDSVYGNDFGDRVIRGRVSYTNTLGGGIGPMKYWLAVSCASGKPEMKFVDVDNGGPRWYAADRPH